MQYQRGRESDIGLGHASVVIEVQAIGKGERFTPGDMAQHASQIEHIEQIAVSVQVAEMILAHEIYERCRLAHRRRFPSVRAGLVEPGDIEVVVIGGRGW